MTEAQPKNSHQENRPKVQRKSQSDKDDDIDLDQYSTEVLQAALGVIKAQQKAKQSNPKSTATADTSQQKASAEQMT